jgi:hypothetical protein
VLCQCWFGGVVVLQQCAASSSRLDETDSRRLVGKVVKGGECHMCMLQFAACDCCQECLEHA